MRRLRNVVQQSNNVDDIFPDHPEDDMEVEEPHPDEVDRTIPIEEKMALMDQDKEEEEEHEYITLEEYQKAKAEVKDEL